MYCDSSIHSNDRAPVFFFFFFNDTATTEIYTLSLHDALPISARARPRARRRIRRPARAARCRDGGPAPRAPARRSWRRSEEHTSELQSPCNLVCRLLLEKKKKKSTIQFLRIHTSTQDTLIHLS